MPNLYIIAGCNGGIAAGLSPFNPESVAMEAGRLMLLRIDQLMKEGVNFAFETTLAARSYVTLIRDARMLGYEVTLLYFWLSSPAMAKERVAMRVRQGGHNIASYIIERRYFAGIRNLIGLYLPICDNWMIINNLENKSKLIANGTIAGEKTVINNDIWEIILKQATSAEK